MFIAKKLRQDNVAEYLLYMWQVEDILRAYRLDIDALQQNYLSRFQVDDEQRDEMLQWYGQLAEMMRSEGVQEKGHLQINRNVILLLSDLHNQLLHSTKHPFYSAAYYKALPFIVELRGRSKAQEKNEIENCFDAMYGLMLLRLQGKTVSEETKTALESISKLMGMLAEYYKKDKAGKLEL